MTYLELICNVEPGTETSEILVALLGDVGFEMFEDFDEGIKAYIPESKFDNIWLNELKHGVFLPGVQIECQANSIPNKNWNDVWESNFQPVTIAGKIYVRAEYHEPDSKFPYELIVHPRMAFGTGHHATTYQMMETMLNADFMGKSVLDMGCGTGILAILASKLGAESIKAVDFDPNSVENTVLNARVNGVFNLDVIEGTMQSISLEKFDFILANINRNIIVSDLALYSQGLNFAGTLFTSGYYEQDFSIIKQKAIEVGLEFYHMQVRDNWCCAIFKKMNQ
ncbi:MAG: 50S ribosomal protein L11 methyltransferase [Bacteroidota bacterium]|jgi:ribosomal protein L11 methyltransferase